MEKSNMNSFKDSHQKDNKRSLRAPFSIYSKCEINIIVNNALGNYFSFIANDIESKTEIQYMRSPHKLNEELIEPIW